MQYRMDGLEPRHGRPLKSDAALPARTLRMRAVAAGDP
jgi:hypothetical protein